MTARLATLTRTTRIVFPTPPLAALFKEGLLAGFSQDLRLNANKGPLLGQPTTLYFHTPTGILASDYLEEVPQHLQSTAQRTLATLAFSKHAWCDTFALQQALRDLPLYREDMDINVYLLPSGAVVNHVIPHYSVRAKLEELVHQAPETHQAGLAELRTTSWADIATFLVQKPQSAHEALAFAQNLDTTYRQWRALMASHKTPTIYNTLPFPEPVLGK